MTALFVRNEKRGDRRPAGEHPQALRVDVLLQERRLSGRGHSDVFRCHRPTWKIGDRRVLRLLRKWLNAGVMEEGTWGLGEGDRAPSSPRSWLTCTCTTSGPHRTWRPRRKAKRLRGRIPETGGQDLGEVRRVRAGTALGDATGGVRTFAAADRRRRERKPETFWGSRAKTRKGRFRLGPSAKRMNRTLQLPTGDKKVA